MREGGKQEAREGGREARGEGPGVRSNGVRSPRLWDTGHSTRHSHAHYSSRPSIQYANTKTFEHAWNAEGNGES